MKKKNELEKLSEKLLAEDITLPETLSAEKIEKLLENGETAAVSGYAPKKRKGKRAAKIIASAAAAIILVAGVTAAAMYSTNSVEHMKQNAVISEKTKNSDRSEIENAVLTYFKSLYNDIYDRSFGVALKSSDAAGGSAMNPAETADQMNGSTDAVYAVGGTATRYSETNVQVNGVDEGDIIKNDGRYIYYINEGYASTGRKLELIITDCEKPESMNIVSRTSVYSGDDAFYYVSDMYLYGDKLAVVTQTSSENTYSCGEETTQDGENTSAICERAINLRETDTAVTVYDISDKADVKELYTFSSDGSYVSSRMINGKLITVSSYSIPYYDMLYNDAYDFDAQCELIKKRCIPEYSVNGNESRKIDSDSIMLSNENKPEAYTVISLLDLNDLSKEPVFTSNLSGGGEVYCTGKNLFIAECEYNYENEDNKEVFAAYDDNGKYYDSVTRIYKYDITDEGVLYKSCATVGGTWLNQFSMDKYGEYFRIATTGYYSGEGTQFSMVYIFDGDMNTAGFLGGIAEGEDIYAARFIGETLYLVTFYQTDPLFVIDLSDPANPKIKGELKLPGFSSYLHPISENLIIGVGVGGNDMGTDGSAKVSLFDISDAENPKEIDSEIIYSASFDTSHKAFMTVDSDTAALCVRHYGCDANDNYTETQSIALFDISDGEITLSKEYECLSKGEYYYVGSIRGAFIGNTIFAVNDIGIAAYDMTTGNKTGEVQF